MRPQSAAELRSMYLNFFKDRGHTIIPSASLIPENDPTVLFTTAGMHPLVPYLLGAKHPAGNRLVDVQKCVRTGDIDEVGDDSHLTFFEMLGNWSLGDYFKKEAIAWSWEFLTSPEYLDLDPEKLAFSVFEGDENAPRDEESFELWRSVGVPAERIFFLPKENNWWGPAGQTGPCGPDSEMFVIMDKEPCGPDCSPACDCGRYLEIWNDVFMQYNKQEDGTFVPLAKPNVDTGMGLERTLCVLTGNKSIYDTELFSEILAKVAELTGKGYHDDPQTTRAFRIISDHLRTSTFMLGDPNSITPSNVDQGYILRRLIRRAVRLGIQLGAPEGFTAEVAKVVIEKYGDVYPELRENAATIAEQLVLEEQRFAKTLKQGEREFEKILQSIEKYNLPKVIDGKRAFKLYDTYGFPIEMTVELAAEHGLPVDVDGENGFNARFKQHQKLSQAGAEQRFKGGLADNSEQTARLHTATHLLHAALRRVLGEEVAQKGSNITAERLRFDFSFGRKMTPEEIAEVSRLVNEAIAADAPISFVEMTVDEAKDEGAIGLFESKYGEKVKVYTMGTFSKEICGGPHASRTGELGSFKIQKEESSSAGVRRIKAVIG
ncbi:alanine--tRNA ligase [Eubacteriales bacterium OttesenSCG-928-A19]|nr:alanine--tRNA ligase [Eubacteriales bacterium OttesenSCG-928-A19]